jgi:ADYC domain
MTNHETRDREGETIMTRASMTTTTTLLVSLGAALAAAACVDPAGGPAAAESTAVQALEECPNFACGQNGPRLNNREFHELSELHTPNREGFSLGHLIKGAQTYQLAVVGWELRGTSAGGNLTGSQLTGATFDIDHDTGKRYRVQITSVSTMQIYAGPLKGATIPQYILKWIEVTPGAPPDHYKNLCANPPTGTYRQETLFQHGESTLVFEGNRYDAQTKRVLAGSSSVFNFGCAGHALSKLFLTGHTSLTGSASTAQQQAALKMLTADYCGDGTSFTVAGEPLYWKSSNGYMTFLAQPESLEGRWGPSGPLCIDEYRLLSSDNPLSQVYFPDAADGTPGVEAAVLARCPTKLPPPCNAAPGAYDFAGALTVSANPPL